MLETFFTLRWFVGFTSTFTPLSAKTCKTPARGLPTMRLPHNPQNTEKADPSGGNPAACQHRGSTVTAPQCGHSAATALAGRW
ncbi:MAG: hypothetical protein SPJ13_00670 [Bacteroidales bacterium]|nr:hypothetical protein [Bacteroidales bacterium]